LDRVKANTRKFANDEYNIGDFVWKLERSTICKVKINGNICLNKLKMGISG